MIKCKECGRKLEAEEKMYCPACESEKKHETKMEYLKKVAIGTLIGIVGLGIKILRKGK